MDVIFSHGNQYATVLIRLRVFHIICAYYAALGKKVNGSGFVHNLIQSKLCVGCSVKKVLKGKQYNRALRVHLLMSESLERLLVSQFFDTHLLTIFQNHLLIYVQIHLMVFMKICPVALNFASFSSSTSTLKMKFGWDC